MKLEFTKKGIVHKPINSWELIDGNTFVIYQGSRGGNPELDYIIKYKAPNKRLRAPSHTHWIFDVLLTLIFPVFCRVDSSVPWPKCFNDLFQ